MKTINSLRSKLLALTLALMASVSTFAYEFEYVNDFHVDGFAYKVLPPTMEAPFGNVALIEIADCTEDVVIPGTVTHEGVTYIVTTLGGGATLFTNSAKEIVKSVFIPKKISTINSPLFADCSNLTSIVVDSRNSYYDSRENCNAIITTSQNSFFTPNMLIAGCKTTTIPNSVTEIADKAFYRSAIESITIPTGVTKIGHSAFNQTLLSSIKLPITLTEIGDWAFADCLSLNTISCYALEPPTISSNTFFGSNPIYNNPSVYVPAYCIEAYKNAEHWKWFTQILPINEPAYKDRWCDTWNVLTIKRELETWQYNLAHDTIIGDYTYTAVTRHTTKVPAGVYPVMAPEPEYVAAVRFTEDKKAFIYYDNTEYLLYDFNAQPGDELTVFAGINHYHSHRTNRCGIGEVNIFPDSDYYYHREISLNVYPNYNHSGPVPTCFGITKWIEGVGDICGLITGADCGLSDDQSALLCAYKDGNTEYTTEYEEYAEYGCEYNSGENKEYILTLPGLQRTDVELSTIEGDVDPYHLSFKEYTPTLVNGKLYLCDGRNYFREENNQVLLYAPYLGMEEDLVLYDWTLEVGDTLPYKPKRYTDEQLGMLFRVTDVSTIQLLDGKEYKKWTFSGGYEFVEGIGAINKGFGHFNCLRHTIHTGMSAGERLVCASRNGQLLIDNTEKWGVECQCEIETSYKSQWCDKWNVLRFDGMRFDETAKTSHYQLGQDTVIGDYTYSKFIPGTYVRFTEDWKVYVYHEGFDDNDPYTVDLPTGEYLAYDFSAKVGDTLEVFSGIPSYTTEQCVVYDVQTDPETNLRTIMLHPLCVVDGDGTVGVSEEEITWLEGVGSPNGFLISTPLPGGASYVLLCAYKDDELKYTGSYYERFGCEYNAGVVSDDLFPTLSGLQRTICREYCEQADNKTRMEQFTNLTTRTETVAPYIYCSPFLLREKDNKIMIYSRTLNKDLVLYDFNLQIGDSLPMLYIDTEAKDDWIADRDMDIWYVVDYHKDLEGNILPADTLIVTDVSMITLLDGKEYKKWTFNNGMEYVEGIGSFGNGQWSGDLFQLIANKDVPTCLLDEHLVCASKNGQLLYQMDDTEMEQLETECLCEYNAEQNPKDLFPTLWGLQRTDIEEHTTGDGKPYLSNFEEYVPTQMNGKLYLSDGRNYLREENNQVLFCCPDFEIYEDIVLYDWTLEIGDTLPHNKSTVHTESDFIVTNVSTVTLLNGKKYKKWTLACGYEYIEGIGAINGEGYGHYLCLQSWMQPGTYIRTSLVCATRNGQLLYKMDDAEMERLGAECLCEIEPKWSETWCNQWNILSHGYLGPQDPLAGARTSIYWLSNNTVNRDGQEYIPLMCSSSKPDVESTNLIGELRFTEDKQVYFYYDNTEYLLYDFDVQVGDTLDIFGGIELYSYSFVEQKTYPHVITKIDTLDDGRLQITSDAIVIFEDGEVGTFEEKQQQIWIEGLGSINGIVHTGINPGIGGNPAIVMLCAYRDDECVYKTDSNDPYWIDYTQLGCVYNEGDFIEGAFPILSGLQRTVCNEYCGETEDDNSANNTYKQTFDKIFFENNKPYILCDGYLLREEDNKILIYSQLLNKDLVLYDFTLEVGDSLPALYIYYHARNAMDWIPYNLDVVDYNKDFEDGTIYPADTFVVTDISNVTLLDGKEYKKWTFNNGMEYVEGIGMYGGRRNGNFFGLIREVVVPCHTGTHLVCVSKNNQLLYQMDEAEMERLGAECLCDYNSGPKKDNAKNGKIGGRPTPTQWNMLEVETKEMDGTPTIVRAETFSYTLENDSIVTKGKTFYQLARQSTKDTAITKSFVGALHFGEDEDNRVYFLRDGVEYVLYDFTAEPGDTIEIFAGINNYPQETTYTHVVVDKDTTEDGACRMFLEVVFPVETTTATNAQKVWLAGLGSIDGIVHNAAKRTSDAHAAPSKSARSSETQTSVMLCAWREDSCLYTTNHPEYDTFGCVYNQDPTALETPTSPSSYQKILHEGKLMILHNGKIYNVLGVSVK